MTISWKHTRQLTLAALLAVTISGLLPSHSANAVSLPDPAVDAEPATGEQSIVLAGGCFWGMQAVFQHVKGVKKAVSGYAGGEADTAQYEKVSSGMTGHAESVKVTYDPAHVTLGKLLKVYFSVAHNPTELGYQGPDHGSQYRSTVFYATPEQKKVTEAYIAQLQNSRAFSAPVVTTVEALKEFYPAEDYHQDYARLHPYNPYIAMNDLPKVEHLKEKFPELYIQ